jgi:hypothetical protein
MFLPGASGYPPGMNLQRAISRRIRFNRENVAVLSDLNADISVNVGKGPSGPKAERDERSATARRGGAGEREQDKA